MYRPEPMLKSLPPYLKILSLLLIVLGSLLLITLIGIVLAVPFFGVDILDMMSSLDDFSNPDNIGLLKFLQIVNQIGLFIAPSILFAFLVNRNVWAYVSFNISPRLLTIILGSISIILALPLISWFAGLNELLELPDSWNGIENWMIRSEEQAAELIEVFLSTSTVDGLILNMIMIAVLPAIGEELLFRGILIRLFNELIKNVHLAVIISALMFSALHLQFYGFLPRFFLGLLLGYLFVWSGSLWVPVIVHFVNNGIAVVAMFMASRGVIDVDMDTLGSSGITGIIIGSVVVTSLLLMLIFRYEKVKPLKMIS